MKEMYKFLKLLIVLVSGPCLGLHAQSSTTFNYTGAVQTWTVPPGVTSIVVNAVGASGGLNAQTHPGCTSTCGNMADSPGNGGCVICTLTVTPGIVLDIYVGGRGADGITTAAGLGGFNGGGDGGLGYTPYAGGGGGGASDVRVPPYGLANRKVVAGGGGGAGGNWFLPPVNYDKGGNGGGTTGQAGTDGGTLGGPGSGGGGTPVSGGIFGTYSGWGSGTSGGPGVGGFAGVPSGGGGGGGGYYGGGGASWAGGGGGSSWTDPVLATAVVHTQGCNHGPNGWVTISVACTPPIPGTILGPSVICQGDTGIYTDPTGTAGGVWSSSNPGVATIGSTTGHMTAVSGGVTTISYSIILSCGTALATTTLTVNPLPAPIGGITNICTGSTSPLTDATPGGVWSSGNTAVAPIGSASGIVSGLTVGLTTVTYTLSATGCYVTTSLNVVGISGPTHVCKGSSVTLTATSTGGIWSSSDPTVGSIDPTAGVVAGIAMGTITISYTLGSGCTALWAFTVNPWAPIMGRDSVCEGSFGYLTNIVGGGAWTSSVTGVATVLPDSGKVYGILAGITTISYLLPTGCLSTRPFTVIAYPTAITGSLQVCPDGTTTLSGTPGGGTWSSGNTSVATIDAYTGVLTGIFADTVDITYSILPGCPIYTKVIVNPNPAPITGPDVMCPGIKDTMFDATAGGLWSSSVTPVLTIVDTNGIVTSISGGLTVIKYQLPTSCYTTKTVSVDPIPVPDIFYNYLLYTFFASPGFATYQWYDSIQGKIPGATSPTLAAINNEYYWVVVTDSNGCIGTSAYYHFNLSKVGVNNYLNSNNVRIFPNPANAALFIEAPFKVRAIISSAVGRKELDAADAREIDISKLANGIYFVTVYDENGVRITVQKIVKE